MSKSAKSKPAKGSIEEKAIELISSKADGIYQSELRRLLGINSSKTSKIVLKLERSGAIRRERPTTGDRRTYLISLSGQVKDIEVKEIEANEIDVNEVIDNGVLVSDAEISLFGRPSAPSNIDTYLTEIYLLYLMRGREKSCSEGSNEGFSRDTAADELPHGRGSGDNRSIDCGRLEDRDCCADLSVSIPDNGCGELSERFQRPGDRCDQPAEETNSQRANQLKRCSEVVIGAIRKRLRSRWLSKSILPGLSSN